MILDLPWDRPPLHANQRLHWAVKAAKTREIRHGVRWLAHNQQPVDGPVCVTLHWQPATKRRRDVDGPYPTLKAAIDGLRDAGVLAEDAVEQVPEASCRIHPAAKPGRMWLEIREAS